LPQRRIVIDLAIEGDDITAVTACHGLDRPFRQIENGEPAMAEPAPPISAPPGARPIGSACPHSLAGCQKLGISWISRTRIVGKDAVYAAHDLFRFLAAASLALSGRPRDQPAMRFDIQGRKIPTLPHFG